MITIKPQQLRILVVEDNLGDYILFEEYLHDTGLDVKEVQNVITVAEAKQALANADYDLVFLDLSLPDSIGIQSIIDLNKMGVKRGGYQYHRCCFSIGEKVGKHSV